MCFGRFHTITISVVLTNTKNIHVTLQENEKKGNHIQQKHTLVVNKKDNHISLKRKKKKRVISYK